MASIKNKKTGEVIEIEDGDDIRSAVEKLGVPFGCRNGMCGTCMIDIVDGEDNLSELNDKEKAMGRDKKHRLACQCSIKSGEVVFDF